MTLDLQRVFESLVIPFLNSCPGAETGHIYGTRRALGKLATPSKRHREEGRTPSISSSESFASSSLATGRSQRRRYPKRVLTKSTTNRAQTRSTSQEWSDAEEQQSFMDEEGSGRRSISVDISISSEELLPSISAPRRETRSMAKRRTRAQNKEGGGKVGGVPYSTENGFGMTLRTRGTKRQLKEDSGSEESSEMEENDQEDDESEAESLDVEQEEDEEEEEEEEEEEAESMTSSFRTRSSRLRAFRTSKVQRKRPRRSSDSDEDLTYKPSKFLTRSSRSGRLVKANTKYT